MDEMKHTPNQEHISFNNEDVIIVDKVQSLPENGMYRSDYVLLIVCTAGKVVMTYDGHKLSMRDGDLFLGLPGSMLSDYMLSPDFDCKILAVKPLEANVPLERHKEGMSSFLHIKDHPVVRLTADEMSMFFSYYNMLCERILKPLHRYHVGEVRALMNAFLLSVVGIMDGEREVEEPKVSIRGEEIVEEFVKMVNNDGGKNRFVSYYAARLNITAKYLSMLVHTSLKRTPTEIIRIVTLKEIERRLRYGREDIKQISNTMNFPNTSFFGKYFKQHVGMTPRSYRKKYQRQ